MRRDESWPLLIAVQDPALRLYLQQYPFACGPDRAMNARAFAAAKGSFKRLYGDAVATVEALDRESLSLSAVELSRAEHLMVELQIPARERAKLIEDFAWRVSKIPRNARSVLAIGCGCGHELLFLRAVLPTAEVTAVDYVKKLLPGLADLVGVQFIGGDLNAQLALLAAQSFDVVFSNHTLEHMYDPYSIVGELARLITPDGCVVSGMPLDGIAVGAFRAQIERVYENPEMLHPVDSILFDFGHPWKADAKTLVELLNRKGLGGVRMIQRAYHLGRMTTGGQGRYELTRQVGCALNALCFGTARRLVRMLFPSSVPHHVLKTLNALDNRVWFGTNRLKNWLAPDIVFVATQDDRSRGK